MVSRAIKLCALVCCLFVVASFALFALRQASGASQHQLTELNTPGKVVAPAALTTPTNTAPGSSATTQPARPAGHTVGQPRRFIDDVAHALTSPFRSFLHSGSAWAIEIASSLCALLLYGLGLGYLARWAKT